LALAGSASKKPTRRLLVAGLPVQKYDRSGDFLELFPAIRGNLSLTLKARKHLIVERAWQRNSTN
jgi:hypothetical protein